MKYFSGIAKYIYNFDADAPHQDDQFFVDLGKVHNIAEVRLNVTLIGTACTWPFQVDVTSSILAGQNHVQVDVTNAWANRLAGDAGAGKMHRPGSEIFLPDAPTYPSEMKGPVRLVLHRPKTAPGNGAGRITTS